MSKLYEMNWIRRLICIVTACIFFVTGVVTDPSTAFAATDSLTAQNHQKFAKDLQDYLYALPAETGSLSGMADGGWRMEKNFSRHPSFFIHLQDAHANPDAQRNIHAILKYLTDRYPDCVIGVEGAAGPLHPENLDFFRDFPLANEAVIHDLAAKGELGGAELFLWQKYVKSQELGVRSPEHLLAPNSRLQTSGIEDIELYRDNLGLFREMLFRREDIQRSLRPIRAELEKESSKILNPELREFLKERSRRKEGRFTGESAAAGNPQWSTYLSYLARQISGKLEIELADPVEQLRFPNLVRFFLLEGERREFEAAKAAEEWQRLLWEIKPLVPNSEDNEILNRLWIFAEQKGFIEKAEGVKTEIPLVHRSSQYTPHGASIYPRQLIEKLIEFAGKNKIDLTAYPECLKSLRASVFQSEIDARELFRETASLEKILIEKLAVTAEEKALVRKIEAIQLLEKLLSLELSRDEYRQAVAEREMFRMIFDSSAAASRGSDETILKTGLSLPDAGLATTNLKRAIEKAFAFYEGTLLRDRALVENALKIAGSEGRTASPPSVVILITGGFHSEGIREVVLEKGLGYAEITPRITETDNGEKYQKVMADENADLSAYFKVKNPFLTKQEAMLFKQLLEVAAPALFETYKMQPVEIAKKVEEAVKMNPVLSQAVSAERLPNEVLQFTPVQGRAVLPLTATIPAVPVMAEPGFARNADPRRDGVLTREKAGIIRAEVRFDAAQALRLRIQSAGEAVRSDPPSVRSDERDILTQDQLAQALLKQLSANAEIPFEASTERIRNMLPDAGSTVTVFDGDGTLWTSDYKPAYTPKVHKMSELLEAVQHNQNLAGVISHKAVVIDDKIKREAEWARLSDEEWARLSAEDRKRLIEERDADLISAAEGAKGLKEELLNPLKNVGVDRDDFDFFVMGIRYQTKFYNYFRIRNRMDPSQPVSKKILPITKVQHASKIFAAHQVSRFMKESFGRDLERTRLIMIGDNVISDLSAMSPEPLYREHEGHRRLMDAMRKEPTIGDQKIFMNGRRYVIVPSISSGGNGRLALFFNGLDPEQKHLVKGGQVSGVYFDLPSAILRALKAFESPADGEKIFVAPPVMARHAGETARFEMRKVLSVTASPSAVSGMLAAGQLIRDPAGYFRSEARTGEDLSIEGKAALEALRGAFAGAASQSVTRALDDLIREFSKDAVQRQAEGRTFDNALAELMKEMETMLRQDREALEGNPWAEGLSGDFEPDDLSSLKKKPREIPQKLALPGKYPLVGPGGMLEISYHESIAPTSRYFEVFVSRISALFKGTNLRLSRNKKDLVISSGTEDWIISPPNEAEETGGEARRQYLTGTAAKLRAALNASVLPKRSEARTEEPIEIGQEREGGPYVILRGTKELGRVSFVYGPQAAAAELVEILAKAGLSVYRDPGNPARVVLDGGREIGAVSVPVTHLRQIREWLACVVTTGPSGSPRIFLRDGIPVIHLRSEVRTLQPDMQGIMKRDEDFAGVIEELEVKLPEEFLFPFDRRNSGEGLRRFQGLMDQLKKHLESAEAPERRKLVPLHEETVKSVLAVDVQKNPAGLFVKKLKQTMAGDPLAVDLLQEFRFVLQMRHESPKSPEEQLERFEHLLKKHGAVIEREMASENMDVFARAMFFNTVIEMIRADYLSEKNREKTLKRIKGSSLIAILYQDILISQVSPAADPSDKQRQIFLRGLFQKRRDFEALRLKDAKAWEMNPVVRGTYDTLEFIEQMMADIAEEDILNFEDTGNPDVVVLVKGLMSVAHYQFVEKKYGKRLKGIINDSATTATHWVAISSVPVLILKPGETAALLEEAKGKPVLIQSEPGPDGKPVGNLFLKTDPQKEKEHAARILRKSRLTRALAKRAPRASDIHVYANVTPGKIRNVVRYLMEGIGLTRTEVDAPAQALLVKWHQKGNVSERDKKDLFNLLSETYRPQVQHPYLKGKVNTFRTFDFQPDKDEDLFVYLQRKDGGFNYYKTPIGKIVLQVQIAVFLVLYGQDVMHERPKTLLRIMFPQVKSVADVEMILTDVLPGSLKMAKEILYESDIHVVQQGVKKETLDAVLETAMAEIHFGVMDETVEILSPSAKGGDQDRIVLDDILDLQYQGRRFIRFVSGGLNDLTLAILEKIDKKPEGSYNRDMPELQARLGRLLPEYIEFAERKAKAIRRANDSLQNQMVDECYCGELAGETSFLSFAYFQAIRHGVPVSLSMDPGKALESRPLLHRIGKELYEENSRDRRNWLIKLFEENPAAADQEASRYAQSFRQTLEDELVELEEAQQSFEAEGALEGLLRTDANPSNAMAGYGAFKLLKSLALRHSSDEEKLLFSHEGEVTPEDLMALKAYLVKNELATPFQLRKFEQAYYFFGAVERLKQTNPELFFRESFHPEKLSKVAAALAADPDAAKAGISWKAEEDVREFEVWLKDLKQNLFWIHADARREAYEKTFSADVVQTRKTVLSFPDGNREILIVKQKKSGLALYSERHAQVGFEYSDFDTFHALTAQGERVSANDLGKYFVIAPETVAVLLRELPSETRFSPVIQRAIRFAAERWDEANQRRFHQWGWPLLQNLLSEDRNIFYPIVAANRLGIFGYFFSPSANVTPAEMDLMERTLMSMEKLADQEGSSLQEVRRTFLNLRKDPAQASLLRQAVFRGHLGDISGHSPEFLAKIQWLNEQRRKLFLKDLFSRDDLEKAVTDILDSMNRFPHFSAQDKSDLLKTLYVLFFSEYMASETADQLGLVLSEGRESPFAAIDQIFAASLEVVQRGLQPGMALDSALHAVVQKESAESAYEKIAELIKVGGWRQVMDKFLDETHDGSFPGLKTFLEQVIQTGADLASGEKITIADLYRQYRKTFSGYYRETLSPEDLLAQLFFMAHLAWIMSNRKSSFPSMATLKTSECKNR